MASTLSHGPSVALSSLTHDDPAEANEPPSPSGISAAAILAALSDSRPPTSQGDDVDELADDHEGGISLLDDGLAMEPAPTVPAAAPTTPYNDDALGLDMLFWTPVPALTGLPPMPTSLLPPLYPPDLSHSLDNIPEDAFTVTQEGGTITSLESKNAFVYISSFYRHFFNPPKGATLLDLTAFPPPEVITREDLRGDECDFQGINWSMRGTTRASVRAKRTMFETERLMPSLRAIRQVCTTSASAVLAWANDEEFAGDTPGTESFFSFRRMNTNHRTYIPHFQLRNLLAATSRRDIFYAAGDQVMRTDAFNARATPIMDLSRTRSEGNRFLITTLASSDDVLIAGGFEGDYALADLASTYSPTPTTGRACSLQQKSGTRITNNVDIFSSRHTYTPQAAFCSNDGNIRILDCYTNRMTHKFKFPAAVNCSATSPDGRLRAVVGDFSETLITNAETGEAYQSLQGHADDVFACAWADDGIHVATAAQDSTIVIWDARSWAKPLQVMYSELAIPRCLRFSPVGSGPPVLVAAEADDYVSFIDAKMWESRQTFDFFGRTAGISFTNDGQSLFLANSEPNFGGIMEFERCGWGQPREEVDWDEFGVERDGHDWYDEEDLQREQRVLSSWEERNRRGVDLSSFVV
ncbi:WD40 repeat-like protein [Amniculicola lignicola CBS 123094]|uniref:WD40 repeat-like protein n=1 Tax=Amniculicola lignicola CBS 123094 TaxID=1392246 RepID=A0A6A5WM15_9PLEO|nr:WD40 repeat-like protein [Amniculicola lignicola CBS 123094]